MDIPMVDEQVLMWATRDVRLEATHFEREGGEIMRSLFVLLAAWLLATISVSADNGEAQPSPTSLQFDVPAHIMTSQVLDMAPSDDKQELRVRTVGGDVVVSEQGSSCNGAESSSCGVTHGPIPPVPPTAEVTDRLVSVDGKSVSLMSFQDVIDAPVGTAAVLPLFKSTSAANILVGFARVEIFRPKTLKFEPTSEARKTAIEEWIQATADYEHDRREWEAELARNAELRERVRHEQQEAQDRERKSRAAREAHERAEFERLRMTPHDAVAQKRREGWEFRYVAEFTAAGPIGLNWDLYTSGKTVVSHLEPDLPAQKLNVIAANDQLIALNGVNTSALEPPEVVELYLQTKLPRTLVFLVSGKRSLLEFEVVVEVPQRIQNWTLSFDSPPILQGWQVRLHLANWSALPNATANSKPVSLMLADPLTACRAMGITNATASVSYLAYRGTCSFIDKARQVQAAGGSSLLVVNNVKGDGRFVPTLAAPTENADIPVMLCVFNSSLLIVLSDLIRRFALVDCSMPKVDGEVMISVLEHDEASEEQNPT